MYCRMGVILTLPGAVLQLDPDIKEGKCALDSTDLAVTLFFLDEIDLASGSIERDYVLNDLLEDYLGGEFMLYFVNCEPNSAVDFDIRLALFNAKGSKLDYLPVGEDMLPFVYLLMFLCFTSLGGLWVWTVVKAKHNAHKIHYLMVVLVAFKSLTLLTQAGMYHMIALVGHPEGWNVAYVSWCLLLCLSGIGIALLLSSFIL